MIERYCLTNEQIKQLLDEMLLQGVSLEKANSILSKFVPDVKTFVGKSLLVIADSSNVNVLPLKTLNIIHIS